MKRIAIIGAAGALCALLAFTGVGYAQVNQPAESGQTAQPRHPDKKKEQAKEKEKEKAQKKPQDRNKSQETTRTPQSQEGSKTRQAKPRQPPPKTTPAPRATPRQPAPRTGPPQRTPPPTERRAQPRPPAARPSAPPRQESRSAAQRRAQEARQRTVWRDHRARDWASQHRTWKQRGGYTGYRIPTSYFRLHYGPTHWFRIYTLPFVYMAGYPRFQYAGYWFVVLDPIPEYWGPYWYEYDDVYVEYVDDGYYLFNRRWPHHPGVAIMIVF